MSMPSDVTPDVAEAVRQISDPVREKTRELAGGIKPAYVGWGVMSFVAFIGVAHLGPAIHRLLRRETALEKTKRLAIEAKHEAKTRAKRARRRAKSQIHRARDLGDRAFRR